MNYQSNLMNTLYCGELTSCPIPVMSFVCVVCAPQSFDGHEAPEAVAKQVKSKLDAFKPRLPVVQVRSTRDLLLCFPSSDTWSKVRLTRIVRNFFT